MMGDIYLFGITLGNYSTLSFCLIDSESLDARGAISNAVMTLLFFRVRLIYAEE